MSVYEGHEPYIFVSYAHKDSRVVLPIIEALQERGYRVWYDGGIEAGTEWPEYIANHLAACRVALIFISDNALASQNCVREINFAISERREILAVYLSDVRLSPGMKMQLGTVQAMYRNRFIDDASFATAILGARILTPCREGASAAAVGVDDSETGEDLSAFFGDDKTSGAASEGTGADSIPVQIYKGSVSDALQESIAQSAGIINRTFGELKISALVTSVEIGPMVTTFRIHVNGTMRLNVITRAVEDLKFALGVNELRFLPPTGRDLTVSIEIPNEQQDIVLLEEILKESRPRESMGFLTRGDTSVCLGRTASGEPFFADVMTFPHMMISGATQTGKTTLLHSMIVSMITRVPRERLGLILVDLKGVEFDIYENEPHMQLPVIHDSKTAATILTELCEEMERRYQAFMNKKVRTIDQYNELVTGEDILPRIIFVVDDYADLILGYRKEIENAVMRLSQKSRAAGIYLILSSQHSDPSTITGVLKANIPSRLAFKVHSAVESRGFIDTPDATELSNFGDALFSHPMQPRPIRINTPYLSVERIISIVKHLIHTEGTAKHNRRLMDKATAYDMPKINENKRSFANYTVPPYRLLHEAVATDPIAATKEVDKTRAAILSLLSTNYNVNATLVEAQRGPRMTKYELTTPRRIGAARMKDIAAMLPLYLNGRGVVCEQGLDNAIFIYVENERPDPVLIRELLESEEFLRMDSTTAVCLGKDIEGDPVYADIASFPHALIGGATGTGKSVCIHSMIASLLYKATPNDVKLLLIDPKTVEFRAYENLPHLLTPIISEVKKAAGALYWVITEMERRYEMFLAADVRTIDNYNEVTEGERLPKIVIVIDEIADLMLSMRDDINDLLLKIAHKGKSAGVHLIVATQRPTTSVISGTLKACLPTRICFKVSSHTDSRVVLDKPGAEKLLGRGEMLVYMPTTVFTVRVQGAYISDDEVFALVKHAESSVRTKDPELDPLFVEAVESVIGVGQVSTSVLQRKFTIGYSRAAKIIDAMESYGIVGESQGGKPRRVLTTREEWERLKGIIFDE